MSLPSGENVGFPSIAGWSVRRRWSLPSAFMTYTSRFPSREESKTIFLPSGDHCGFSSTLTCSGFSTTSPVIVSRTGFEPSAFMT
jgi:hypothetical protein